MLFPDVDLARGVARDDEVVTDRRRHRRRERAELVVLRPDVTDLDLVRELHALDRQVVADRRVADVVAAVLLGLGARARERHVVPDADRTV